MLCAWSGESISPCGVAEMISSGVEVSCESDTFVVSEASRPSSKSAKPCVDLVGLHVARVIEQKRSKSARIVRSRLVFNEDWHCKVSSAIYSPNAV